MSLYLCEKYLKGLSGIEIGGSSHNSFPIDALNVDRYAEMDTVYKKAEVEAVGWAKPVDIVAPGDDLPIPHKSQDFVFASHVIEHFPDPIRALKEWNRVARDYIVLVVPHRDRTFDRERRLTPLWEIFERHMNGFESNEDKHWTVWNLQSFLDMCEFYRFDVIDYQDPDDKVGNGFSVVIKAK